MAILSDFVKGSINVAQVSLTANAFKSPVISPNTWINMPFNVIDINQNSIITSINSSASSIDLKSGIYQALFYHCWAIDAPTDIIIGKRFFNITANSEITRYPQVVYNNVNSPLFPNNYFTSDITFNLATNSTIALQFFHTRITGTVQLHYCDAAVSGATIIDGINRGYILNLYKLD